MATKLSYSQLNNPATVAELITLSPSSGDTVKTVGYHDGWAATKEPKGGGKYVAATLAEVRAVKGDNAWVPDELIDHTAANGLIWMLQHEGSISLSQAGAQVEGDIYPSFAAAIAIDGIAEIKIPPGIYTMSACPVINKAIRIDGAGASSAAEQNSGGSYGSSTTYITCTGTNINGLEISGDATEGVENVHLSNFELVGSNNLNDGIVVGTLGFVSRSSLKNVVIRGFRKSEKFGLRLTKCLETYLENVYSFSCYYGWGNKSGDIVTSLRTKNVMGRLCETNGLYIGGTFLASELASVLNEGNGAAGLRIRSETMSDVISSIEFYGYYSEFNNAPTERTLGGPAASATISIGTDSARAVRHVRFNGGGIYDSNVTFPTNTWIELDKAELCVFDHMSLPGNLTDFITATADTAQCRFLTAVPDSYDSRVTGNTVSAQGVLGVSVETQTPKRAMGNLTYDLATASGTTVITGLTFSPKYVTLIAVVNITNKMSFGNSNLTANHCIADANGVVANAYEGFTNKALTLEVTGSDYVQATISNAVIGGFTINWTKTGSPTGTATVMYTVEG
jgi:hypothetical protein